MAVQIDENILIFFMGAVFIPLTVFCIKLIIDIGIIKSRIESMCEKEKEHERQLDKLDGLENRVNILDVRIDRLEKQDDDRRSPV